MIVKLIDRPKHTVAWIVSGAAVVIVAVALALALNGESSPKPAAVATPSATATAYLLDLSHANPAACRLVVSDEQASCRTGIASLQRSTLGLRGPTRSLQITGTNTMIRGDQALVATYGKLCVTPPVPASRCTNSSAPSHPFQTMNAPGRFRALFNEEALGHGRSDIMSLIIEDGSWRVERSALLHG